jgi:hypothetical protein
MGYFRQQIFRHRAKVFEAYSKNESLRRSGEGGISTKTLYDKYVIVIKSSSEFFLFRLVRKFGIRIPLKYIFLLIEFLFLLVKGKEDHYDKKLEMEKEVYIPFYKNENSFKKHCNKLVVYTVITGGYDVLCNVDKEIGDCDFICFTDNKNELQKIETSGWEVIEVKNGQLNDIELSRYIKINPHIFLKNYNYSLYIDGNIQIVGDVKLLLSTIPDKSKFSVFKHLFRDNIYEEVDACLESNKIKYSDIDQQIEYYKKDVTFNNHLMYEANVLYRDHKDIDVIKTMELWWSHFLKYSKRDQISLPYIVHKTGLYPDLMAGEYISARNHPCLLIRGYH